MQSAFHLTYFDPPPELERYLTVLFYFATDLPLVEDSASGALGQFHIFPKGTGEIAFEHRTDPVVAKAHLVSNCSFAPKFKMHGPWHCIGSTLTPLGWVALTGKPASEYVDCLMPASQLLGPEVDQFAEELSAQYNSGEVSPEFACHLLGQWITDQIKPISPQHEAVIERTIAWLGDSLNPDLDTLFDSLAYSRRQSERLIERFFGFPPAALIRKFRAVRAAAMLARDDLTESEVSAIAEAFYDQPHMIKEIRRYCGFTPARFGGEERPILKTLMQMKNFDRLQKFRAVDPDEGEAEPWPASALEDRGMPNKR